MPSTRSRPFARLAVLAVTGVALAGCLSNSDGFYGSSEGDAPDVALVKSLMGSIGAIDPKTKPIVYEPRAPLAMPGERTNLPNPEAEANAVPPNWPRDKDAELAGISADADRRQNRGTRGGEPLNSRVAIQDVQKGVPVGQARARGQTIGLSKEPDPKLSIHDMKNLKVRTPDSSAILDENGQPKRQYLIDPPVEYSTPAATAAFEAPDVERKPNVDQDELFDTYDAKRDR